MKKNLILILSCISLVSLCGCASKSTMKNQVQELLNNTYGTKSATTCTVTVDYNLAEEANAYDVIYVEKGSSVHTALGKDYSLSLQGRTFEGLSYDKYGVSLFDQTSVISEDMTLYAYTIPSAEEGVDTPYEYEEEVKAYSLTWKNGSGCSFALKDGGTLPSYASEGEEISFFVNYNEFYSAPSVYQNSSLLSIKDGYYTITVNADTIISTSDVSVTTSQANPLSKVYLMSAENSWKMNADYRFRRNLSPSYSDEEYYMTGVSLSKGEAFKIYNFNADSWLGASSAESGVYIANDVDNNFVAIADGTYDIYLKYTSGVASVYISTTASMAGKTLIRASDALIETGYDYHLWTWNSSSSPLGYVSAELIGTTLVAELPSSCYGFLVGKFTSGTEVSDGSTSWISCLSQSNDITLIEGTVLYTASVKA